MFIDRFYQACAQACFALLGLWWVVVRDKYKEWMPVPYRRRQAYSISLYFALPGVMSLFSLITPALTTLWRIGFGSAGALGVLETAGFLRRARREGTYPWQVRALLWGILVLYMLVVLVAIWTRLPRRLGLSLSGRPQKFSREWSEG